MNHEQIDSKTHMEHAFHCASRVGKQCSEGLRKRMINQCLSYLRKAVNRGRV